MSPSLQFHGAPDLLLKTNRTKSHGENPTPVRKRVGGRGRDLLSFSEIKPTDKQGATRPVEIF